MPETAPDARTETILAVLGDALHAEHIALGEWEAGLTVEVSLDEDLGLDSFQLMKVARHLEKAYGFAFSLADWVLEEEEKPEPTYTVGSLVDFVQRHVGASS